VTRLSRLYGVTRGGYYAWRRRAPSAHAVQDRTLLREIARLFSAHHGRYGSPRLHQLLQRQGWLVSRRRVARLMRASGLRAKAVRGYRAKVGTHRFYEQHRNHARSAAVERPNQVWVGDITYLAVAGTWRYLAVVMDRYSRRILAWTLGRRRDARVTRAVLNAAVQHRAPPAGLIFHSDRGSEYLAAPFRDRLVQLRIQQSACESGPGDNAHMESFFHSFKAEAVRGLTFTTDAALRRALRHFFHYYNHARLHSALGFRSPVAFEAETA
jgi:transposase InsO family protein